MSFWFRTAARLAVLREHLHMAVREVEELHAAAEKRSATEARTAASKNAAPSGPPQGQLCTCTCEDDACENCPNVRAARWDTERELSVVAPPAVDRRRGRAAKRARVDVVHVNKPESAGEESDEEADAARRALRSFRKMGCFPLMAIEQPAAGFEHETTEVTEEGTS